MKTRIFPERIKFTAFDPLDNRELHSSDLPYSPRKSAAGFYTDYFQKMIKISKVVFGDILEYREPRISVETY